MTDLFDPVRIAKDAVSACGRADSTAVLAINDVADHVQAWALSTELAELARTQGAIVADLRARIADQLRAEEGLSLSQLATRLGISKARADQIINAAKSARPVGTPDLIAAEPEPEVSVEADVEILLRGPVRTALYWHYDADGILLYVGISDQLAARGKSHAAASSWIDFAHRADAKWFPTREDAALAEIDAIKAGLPLFNHQHNDTPEARARLVAYLVEKNRLDLLMPAVSRG